jgi:protein SCO1/2
MQDAKFARQTGTGVRQLSARALLSLCMLHFAFCMSTVSAQQQPGMPGSMGFSSGIVASNVPPQFKDVTFKQRLGDRLPLDTHFKDEAGRDVTLGEYFGKKPVIVSFVYYQCPMLCTQVLNGISSSLKVLPFTAGREFDVVLVSFDPRDTPEAATAKKRAHLDHWNVRDTSDGWHFLTGDEDAIRRVTSAAGFSYTWDPQSQQFAHVSGLLVANVDGTLSRYFYGVEFSPRDLRLALVDSGNGKVGSVIDELLLYCFQYDPSHGRYGAVFMNILRLGGVVTVGFIVGFIVLMRRREMRSATERHA